MSLFLLRKAVCTNISMPQCWIWSPKLSGEVQFLPVTVLHWTAEPDWKHLPELEGFPMAESWQSSFHTPCWAQHKRREERAKSTACSIPAHPQPSQHVLVATGSGAQRQQPGYHKFQRGSSPVTCFIAQHQGSTATAASLFSELLCQLLGCGKRPQPPHRSWASSTRQFIINSKTQNAGSNFELHLHGGYIGGNN